MHFLVFGGSRNIGYHATLRLLNQGNSATFLLRSAKVFDDDEKIKPHVESGKAELVEGDALVLEDVKRVWEKATESGRTVDYVVFTIGATPDMGSFKVTKGFVINPPNITTKAILNVLCTKPESAKPKIIAITSIGVTKDSPVPLVYKPLYGYLLRAPHADKLGLERVLAHVSGRKWEDREPRDDITTVDGVKWQDRTSLPASGSLEVLVIRPPAFVESKQKSAPPSKTPAAAATSEASTSESQPEAKKEEEKPKYRVGGPELKGTYAISREEVGHFIAENAVKNWDEFKNKAITVSR